MLLQKYDWQEVEGIDRCCCVMGAPVYGNGVLGDQTKHIVQTRECPRVPRCDKFPQMVGTRSGIANAKVGKPGWCALRVGDPMILGQKGKGKLQSFVVPLILYCTTLMSRQLGLDVPSWIAVLRVVVLVLNDPS